MPFRLGDASSEDASSDEAESCSEGGTEDEEDKEEEDEEEDEEDETRTSAASSSVRAPPGDDVNGEGKEDEDESASNEDHDDHSHDDDDDNDDEEEENLVSPPVKPKVNTPQNSMSRGGGKPSYMNSSDNISGVSFTERTEQLKGTPPESPSKQSVVSTSSAEMSKPTSYELPGLGYGSSSSSSPSSSRNDDDNTEESPAPAVRRNPPKRQVPSVSQSPVKKPQETKASPTKSPVKKSALKSTPGAQQQTQPKKSPVKQQLKGPPKSPVKKTQQRPVDAKKHRKISRVTLSKPTPIELSKAESDSSFSFSSDTDPSLAAKLASAGVGYNQPLPAFDERKVSFQSGGAAGDDDDDDDDDSESYETYESDESSDEFETDTEGDNAGELPLPQYGVPPIREEKEDESSDYETDTTYERQVTGDVPPPGKKPSTAPIVRSSTGSVALSSDHSGLLNQPTAAEAKLKKRGRRKPFENIPSLIDADTKGVKPIGRRGDIDSGRERKGSSPLGLSGWDQQDTSGQENVSMRGAEEVKSEDQKTKKSGMFGWLFGGKKRKEPSQPSSTPTNTESIPVANEPTPEVEPVYDPPEYDDNISQVTDRVFFPKTSKPRKSNPPPRRDANPDYPDMTPSDLEREIQDQRSRFSVRSFRRNNDILNDRALEDLDPTSVLIAPGNSEPRQEEPQKEKRNTKMALAGLPALSVRKHNEAGATRRSPDAVRAALLDMKSESVDLDIKYDLDTPVQDFANAPADLYLSRAILMNEALGAVPEDGEQESEKDIGGLATTESMEDEDYEEEEIIFEEEYVEEERDGDIEEYTVEEVEDLEHPRELSLIEEKEQEEESGMSFTTRSIVYCIVVVLLLAAIGVGIWLILKYIVFDDSSPSPSGLDMSTPPPGAGPSYGDTPPSLPPTITPISSEDTQQDLVETLSPYLPDNGDSFEDPDSPQSHAIGWMSRDPQVYSYDGEKLATRFALATLYYSTNGDDWTNNDLWLSDEDECLWYTSSELDPCSNGRYVQLRLGDNNLQGIIPEELGLLSNALAAMDLGGILVSKIPWTIGDLRLLTSLRLRGNQLSGTIPDSMRSLSKLSYLDLRQNKLEGTISSELLLSLSSLGTLDLGENELTGPLPPAIGNLGNRLTWFSVENNRLNGPVPEELGDVTALTYLNLDSNDFQSLPASIDILSNLKILSAKNNLFQGPLPESIAGRLTNLEALDLSNNGYTGTIPESYGLLTSLKTGLDLSSNELSGALPESLGQVSALKSLSLRDNMFSGMVPLALGALSVLDNLRLDANNLTGELPPAMCDSFNEASSSYYADCRELACPCCNFCCDDETGECTCRFANSQPILCIP